MKKIITIILLVLFLTGCSAKYDIYFDEDKINDTIEIYENSSIINTASDEKTNEINSLLLDWENGYDHYKRELYSTDVITGYRYTYDFDYIEYDSMSHFRKCYDDIELTYDKNIVLKTTDEFLCGTYYPNTKEIVINITSEYEITSSNADKKNNNTHTWIINKSNYKNKPIELTINKDKDYKEPKENKLGFKQIFVIIIFITLIVILRIRKRRNK